MSRIIQKPDGSFHWDCPIGKDYHRRSGRQGILGTLLICAVIFVIFITTSHGTNTQGELWIPFLVAGVILLISLPLLYLWNSASEPREQYVMNENYVKSGYGKSSVYFEFRKTVEIVAAAEYLELIGKNRISRIYVPPEDMDFVRKFISERVPDDAVIRYRE